MIKEVRENITKSIALRYAIVEKASEELIGTFLITPVSNVNCKVGCSFGKKYWSSGYGFETMTIMSDYLRELKYEKMIGLIKKENLPSIRLVEKMDFKLIEQTAYPEFYQYEKVL